MVGGLGVLVYFHLRGRRTEKRERRSDGSSACIEAESGFISVGELERSFVNASAERGRVLPRTGVLCVCECEGAFC